MKEETIKYITDNKTIDNKKEEETTKEKDTEFQMPTLLKFDKNYDNLDLNIFKEDILDYLNERDKSIFSLIKVYKEKMEKTEKKYLELTNRISNNYSEVLSSQAQINNRLDKLNSFEAFSMKANDQLISHEIRINHLREDYNKSVQKYDKIYLDNLELPGYIGKYAKYKNCQVFFDEVIKEINRLNTYKEKNILDLKAYKEKLEQIIKTFNTLVDNNNKSQIKYINEMNERNNKECKNLIDTLAEKLNDMRIENSRYAVELIGKSINLTKEWDKIEQIKEEITKDFNEKILDFKIVSNNTINSFYDFKTEFNLIKRKFFELAEFIKDVRFRKNIGGEVKKKEIKCITKKITGKKSCATIDKDKEKALLEINYKIEKNEKNEKNDKNDLRKSVSQEQVGKNKTCIKGGTNVEEFKEDSKMNDISEGKNIKKKITKFEYSKNYKNINIREDSIVRRKYKSPTIVSGSSNLKKYNSLKKDNFSDESDNNSVNNNSLSNLIQVNHTNANTSIEQMGTRNTNFGNTNNNNRYLFKDILIETEDKIINELASELEQTNNKLNNKSKEKNEKIQSLIEKIEPININMNINEIASELENSNNRNENENENKSKEKSEKIQNIINKVEPMNINMNINKIENLNLHSSNRNNKTIKSPKISKKTNNTFMTANEIGFNSLLIDKKISNCDKKITNLEIYIKEKIVDLIAQIENLRQLFLSTNKLQSFSINPLFNFPSYTSSSTNILNQPQAKNMKEAHIVEIGAKILPPPAKITKRYTSNSNNIITAKDKENINKELYSNNAKNDINLPKDISHRIKTGKNPTSIKTIINRTLGANANNTIIFSNMANDINSKFLKGVEKKSIIDGGIANKTITENKINNINKFIELNKITTNLAIKTQNNFKNEINLLAGNNSNLP